MKSLIALFSMLLSLSVFAGVNQVPSIELSGLEKYRDQNISVFYVSGRPAGFGTFGHILHTHKIWAKVSSKKINGDGTISIPSVKVVNTHGVAFNYLVFVIHDADQKNARLMNTDSTCPAQPGENAFASEKEYCMGFSTDEFQYKIQKYKSVRSIKAGSDGIARIKL